MKCAACREVLAAALDGQASNDELGHTQDHMNRCGSCRAFAGRLARLEGPMATCGISAELAVPGDIPSLGDPAEFDLAIILGSDESAYDD